MWNACQISPCDYDRGHSPDYVLSLLHADADRLAELNHNSPDDLTRAHPDLMRLSPAALFFPFARPNFVVPAICLCLSANRENHPVTLPANPTLAIETTRPATAATKIPSIDQRLPAVATKTFFPFRLQSHHA